MIKIAIAEDNNLLAASIKEKLLLFGDDVKYKYRGVNGENLLEKLKEDSNIDMILMDIEMPVMNGIEATAKVKSLYPHIKIVMLTVFDDEENIFKSIQAGADGYLLKDESPKVVYDSIMDMMKGGAPMSPTIAAKALKLLRNPITTENKKSEEYNLTKRELEVLEQLCAGLDYKSIALNLIISTGTVRKHIENIYGKLQVSSKGAAIHIANKERLVG